MGSKRKSFLLKNSEKNFSPIVEQDSYLYKKGRIKMLKKVAVIMGSDSDWDIVKKAVNCLKEYGVETEVHVKIGRAHV